MSEAVSFAIPDEMYGQEVAVAVVLNPGQKLNADELKAWVADKLAKFKVPKKVCLILNSNLPNVSCTIIDCPKVYFTDNMPKTATGKIQRRIVADTMVKQEQPKAKL